MIKIGIKVFFLYTLYAIIQYYFTSGYVIAIIPAMLPLLLYIKEETKKLKGIDIIRYLIFYSIIIWIITQVSTNTNITNVKENTNLYVYFSVIVISPIWEELIFRKYLYYDMQIYIGDLLAMGISAILFILIHTPNTINDTIRYLIPTIFLIYAYKKSEYDLKVPVIIHMFNNLISVII